MAKSAIRCIEKNELRRTLFLKHKKFTKLLKKSAISILLPFGDFLVDDIGTLSKKLLLNIAVTLYLRSFIKLLTKIFPIGLCLIIKVKRK